MATEELYERLDNLDYDLSEKEGYLRQLNEKLDDARISLYQLEHSNELDIDESPEDIENDKSIMEERLEYYTQLIEEVEDEISMIQREIEQVEFEIEMSHEDKMGF